MVTRTVFAALIAVAKGRGLTGSARAAHNDVVLNLQNLSSLELACSRRLALLRRFVSERDLDSAIQLSFALEARSLLPNSCRHDVPFAGNADMAVRVSTPVGRQHSRVDVFATIDNRTFPCVISRASSRLNVPVVGVVLDGVFAAREASPKSRASPRTAASRLEDEDTTYTVGSKTLLIMPICPSDVLCNEVFDYGLTQSDHGGDVASYLERVVMLMDKFVRENSFNSTNITETITPALQLNYTSSECGTVETLGYYSGQDARALDVMAFDAAASLGYARNDYDFHAIVAPWCADLGIGGVGWIGYPGFFINLAGQNYDASFAHELGHNFGARHASFADDDTRGGVAWWDSADVVEYGCPFCVMGAGDVEPGDLSAHFLVQGKLVFDWIDNAYVRLIAPYANSNPLCSPSCGPYELQAVDLGAYEHDTDIPLALIVETATSDRFLFCEYRSSLDGVVCSWGDVGYTRGNTGIYGNSILVDATPGTTSLSDASLRPGSSITLDVGTSDAPASRIIQIFVDAGAADETVSVTVVSTDTAFPTQTPAPTTPAPTLRPSPASEFCGNADVCCAHVEINGITYTKMRAHDSPNGYCCSQHCSYSNPDETFGYVQYIQGYYYVTKSAPCWSSGGLAAIAQVPASDVATFCEGLEPSSAPTDEPVTRGPTYRPSTRPTVAPTIEPTDYAPTWLPTLIPSSAHPAYAPTIAVITLSPAPAPTTASPFTFEPSSSAPSTPRPSSLAPSTPRPSSSAPSTPSPSSSAPSMPSPSTMNPTPLEPTLSPTTPYPTASPSGLPTTLFPTSLMPTRQPTWLLPTSSTPTGHPSPLTSTFGPSGTTTSLPTQNPSASPMHTATTRPSAYPTRLPTSTPSRTPTSTRPSAAPVLHTSTPVSLTLSPTPFPTSVWVLAGSIVVSGLDIDDALENEGVFAAAIASISGADTVTIELISRTLEDAVSVHYTLTTSNAAAAETAIEQATFAAVDAALVSSATEAGASSTFASVKTVIIETLKRVVASPTATPTDAASSSKKRDAPDWMPQYGIFVLVLAAVAVVGVAWRAVKARPGMYKINMVSPRKFLLSPRWLSPRDNPVHPKEEPTSHGEEGHRREPRFFLQLVDRLPSRSSII